MTDKLEEVNEGVEEVKVLMVENVNKIDERGEKLTDLEERSEKLLSTSATFHKQSKKIRVKKERENLKSKAGMIAIVVVLFLIIIIVIAVMLSTSGGGPSEPPIKSNTSASSGGN